MKIAGAKPILLVFPKIEIFFLNCPATVFGAIDPLTSWKANFFFSIFICTKRCDDIFVWAETAFDTDGVIIVAFISFCLSICCADANE